jgi:uncharacterized membrane protein
MINKTTLSIFAIVAALALATAVVATTIITTNSAFAGGPKSEKNYGQCKQDFNSNPCKKFHTGSG